MAVQLERSRVSFKVHSVSLLIPRWDDTFYLCLKISCLLETQYEEILSASSVRVFVAELVSSCIVIMKLVADHSG